tara:strand:+ start:450 stop:2177 length:1728 start_codon:yes stop_codon:yes gene_type:complete
MLKQWAVWIFALLPVFCQADGLLNVKVDGVSKAQEQNIRAFISIEQLNNKSITSRTRLRYLHNKAPDQIRKALQPFGFYRPQITSTLTENDKDLLAHYQIDPGPPLLINRSDLLVLGEAQDDALFIRLLAEADLHSGAPLLHSHYEQLKRQLRSLAAEQGYYQAAFIEQTVEVDLGLYQANIRLHFDSGPRYYVGDFNFSPGPFAPDFLARYVPFKRGDPVQSSALIDLQTALVDTDYFQRVEVRPLWDQADGVKVPIDINLEPHKRTKYRTGMGYGTDTGARVKLGMTQRWVNSRGHQLNTQLLASQIRRSLDSQYSIPGKKPTQDRYALRFSLSDENSEGIDAQNQSVGLSWQNQQGKWQRLLGLDWEQERFTFGGETQRSKFLIPRFSLSSVTTKDRLNVQQGHRLTLEFLGGSDVLFSDTNFVQARLSGKLVHSLTPKLRFLSRFDAGTTLADDFDQIPATLRFFAGGDNSVRGYGYQSLAPKDEAGVILGAPNLLALSAEVDYKFKEKWAVAAFVDSGNAFEDTQLQLHTGIGIGLRWFSVIGPVRLDLAFPQNSDQDGFRLHFSLGPDL